MLQLSNVVFGTGSSRSLRKLKGPSLNWEKKRNQIDAISFLKATFLIDLIWPFLRRGSIWLPSISGFFLQAVKKRRRPAPPNMAAFDTSILAVCENFSLQASSQATRLYSLPLPKNVCFKPMVLFDRLIIFVNSATLLQPLPAPGRCSE